MPTLRLALLTAGCVSGLLSGTTAQRSSLKHALPASSIAFFSLPDLDKSVQELLDMPLLRMWRQQEFQGFLAPALVELDKRWKQALEQAKEMHAQGALPFSPEDLLQLRLYGVTAGFTHFRLIGDQDPLPDIGLMVHLDFGPSAPLWKKVLDFGMQQMEGRAGEMLTRSESEASGFRLTTWQVPDFPIGLSVAWVGDGIVVGTVQKDVTAALAALANKGKLLTEAAGYKAVAANTETPGAEIEFFVNTERAYRTLFDVLEFAEANAPDFPPELNVKGLDRAFDALGLKAIKAVGATSTYQGDRAVTKSYTLCPAPERKGLMADGTKNLDLSCLRWVPKDATACSASSLNVTAVWDSLVNAFKAYDENLAKDGLAHLAEIEKQVSFTIRDDLCGAFGDQMLSWSVPMKGIPGIGGGSLISGLYLVQMKDKDRLLKCLEGLKQISQGQMEFGSNTRDELTTYFIKLNVELPGNWPINPLDMIQPVFGFQGDYMVLGFARPDVRKTMTAMTTDKPEADTILGNKEFASMLSKLQADRLTSVSFTDNRASFDNIYGLAYGFSTMLPEDLPLDVSQLPDEGGFLSQHLCPSVSHSHSDGTGFSSVQIGPFGPELGLVIGAVAGGAGASAAWLMPRGGMRRR